MRSRQEWDERKQHIRIEMLSPMMVCVHIEDSRERRSNDETGLKRGLTYKAHSSFSWTLSLTNECMLELGLTRQIKV